MIQNISKTKTYQKKYLSKTNFLDYCRKINFITYESGKDPSAKIRSKVKMLIHYFLRTPHKTVLKDFFKNSLIFFSPSRKFIKMLLKNSNFAIDYNSI